MNKRRTPKRILRAKRGADAHKSKPADPQDEDIACVLCGGGPVGAMGVWCLSAKVCHLLKKNYPYTVVYVLCKECSSCPPSDFAIKVEDRILSGVPGWLDPATN